MAITGGGDQNNGFLFINNPPPRIPGSGGNKSNGGPQLSINLANLPTTGGLQGITSNLLISGFDIISDKFLIYLIDFSNFNCEEDVQYDFRVEEIEPGNTISIHNVLLRYRDIGQVKLTVGILNYQNISFTSKNSKTITIGNKKPTFRIFTKKVDIPTVTVEAPFIRIFRKANDGPLSITKVRAWGSYGDGDII